MRGQLEDHSEERISAPHTPCVRLMERQAAAPSGRLFGKDGGASSRQSPEEACEEAFVDDV